MVLYDVWQTNQNGSNLLSFPVHQVRMEQHRRKIDEAFETLQRVNVADTFPDYFVALNTLITTVFLLKTFLAAI